MIFDKIAEQGIFFVALIGASQGDAVLGRFQGPPGPFSTSVLRVVWPSLQDEWARALFLIL
jgi:hypothetical protein